MKAKANTTSEQSNEKSMEVGDPRMAEMEEQEKKQKVVKKISSLGGPTFRKNRFRRMKIDSRKTN